MMARTVRMRDLAPIAAAVIAAAVVAVAIRHGARVAGGSDSWGYVSQARLWSEGRLRIAEPLMADPTWSFGGGTLVPLGYMQSTDGASLVPTYAPGYPMVMAAFETIGGPEAVYLVVPLMGGVAVLATYALGAYHAGAVVGLAAALLLATSPVFLLQLMFAMSDVPVTAWWAVTLALAALPGPWTTLAAGLATSGALLTRPNLVLVAAAVGILLVVRDVVGSGATRKWSRSALYAAGVAPSCVAIALLHTYWYGSPLRSGYGPSEALFAWRHLRTNAVQFTQWLIESQTPAVLLAFAAPLTASRLEGSVGAIRTMLVGAAVMVGAVALSYAFYLPFGDWWYLRFLLPAYPALFVLMAAGIVGLCARLPSGLRTVAIAIAVGGLAWHGYRYAVDRAVFTTQDQEQRYVAVGKYVDRWLPRHAAILSMQHSGSIRYYSGRLTVRYDVVRRDELDAIVDDLERRGYAPYIVLDAWEEALFRDRFGDRSPLGSLNWPPVTELTHPSRVRIYDPRQRTVTPADQGEH